MLTASWDRTVQVWDIQTGEPIRALEGHRRFVTGVDIEGDTAVIGKPQGSDSEQNKPTYPNILGMDAAKDTAKRLCDEAIACLDPFGPAADTLRQLAAYIVNRDR